MRAEEIHEADAADLIAGEVEAAARANFESGRDESRNREFEFRERHRLQWSDARDADEAHIPIVIGDELVHGTLRVRRSLAAERDALRLPRELADAAAVGKADLNALFDRRDRSEPLCSAGQVTLEAEPEAFEALAARAAAGTRLCARCLAAWRRTSPG